MRIISINAAKVAFASLAALFLFASPAQAQLRIGLRVAPLAAFGRVQDYTRNDLETPYAGSQEVKFGTYQGMMSFSGGLILDYFFKSNYAFGTGVYYTVKRASVDGGPYGRVNYNLQQIQIPLTIKLYTNEIAPDFKIYFQLGASPDFVIAQKLREFDPVDPTVKEPEGTPLRPVDVSLIFGTGVEYRIAESTTLFAGIFYNRGLVNLNNKNGLFDENSSTFNGTPLDPIVNKDAGDRYGVRVDAVGLDVGIKF